MGKKVTVELTGPARILVGRRGVNTDLRTTLPVRADWEQVTWRSARPSPWQKLSPPEECAASSQSHRWKRNPTQADGISTEASPVSQTIVGSLSVPVVGMIAG